MAHFHHGIASDSITQGSWNPCLYASTNPYSLYASSARLSRYGASEEGFPHYANGNSGVSSSLFNGNVWYANNSHLQTLGHAYEPNCVPSVSMAALTSGQQNFGEVVTSLTALQMASNFAGFSEASNLAKCHKPAHPFYWRKRGNSVPAEGMTRTKDKYRVVYTEKQRIGLEKAFKDNKFITMKEKNVLSKDLDLSERQVRSCFIIFHRFFSLDQYLFIILFVFHLGYRCLCSIIGDIITQTCLCNIQRFFHQLYKYQK